MSTNVSGFSLFRAIFGGFIANYNGEIIAVKANPILLTGFILSVVGLLLLVLIFISHKTALLNKKLFISVTVFAIVCFATAGILFCFKEVSIKNQIAQVTIEGQHISEEALKNVVVSADTGDIAFIIAQFIAAASLISVLVTDKLSTKY